MCCCAYVQIHVRIYVPTPQTCTIGRDGTFRLDLGFAASKFVRKYRPLCDAVLRCDIEARCWLDLLRINNTHDAAECKLEQLCNRLLQASPPNPSRRRADRDPDNVRVFDSWRTRVASTMEVVKACTELLRVDAYTGAVALQQLVHFTQRCSGVACIPHDSPIYGVRYECLQCKQDFCNACYVGHDPTHVLQLHRTVLPCHAATHSSRWEVLHIDKHEDGNAGRLYRVVWAGNWAPEFLTRASLNNNDLVDG